MTRARVAIAPLLLLGALLADFTPLSLVGALQLSDLLVLCAGALAVGPHPRQALVAARARIREHPRLRWVIAAAALYLVGTGAATVIAGMPPEGVRTWLLYAMLVLGIAPATAVALGAAERAPLALRAGLLIAALLAGVGFFGRLATGTENAIARGAGPLGSDPYFVMLVGIVIAVAAALAGGPWWRRGLAVAAAGVIAGGLLLSGYRSGWGAVLAVVPLMVLARLSWRIAVPLLIGAAALAWAAYATGALPDTVMARIDMTLTGGDDLDSRSEVIDILLPVWADHPWGIGLGESSGYLPAYLVFGATGAVHVAVLNALIEGGPLAALGLTALPFALAWAAWPERGGARWAHTAAWALPAMWITYVAAQGTPSYYPRAAWLAIGAVLWIAAGGLRPREAGS